MPAGPSRSHTTSNGLHLKPSPSIFPQDSALPPDSSVSLNDASFFTRLKAESWVTLDSSPSFLHVPGESPCQAAATSTSFHIPLVPSVLIKLSQSPAGKVAAAS